MKATCNREGLSTAFQVASGVVPARSPKPILRNVKFDLREDGQAVLMATDLELGIRYRVSGVTTEQPGVAMLPTSEMMAILRELPDETIVLEGTESGVRIIGSSAKFELPGEDPLQFPEIPDFGDIPSYKIKAGVFSGMVRRTLFAAAGENSRYALHSVLIELEEGKASLVATDGKRLAMMPGSLISQGEKPTGNSLLHPKALSMLQKVLSDPDEELEIGLHESEALFRTGKVTIYSRLVEGRFPRYQDVFPGEANVKIPLVVGKFNGVVRQAKIVTSEDSKGVDFRFSEGMLTLESRSSDVGQSEIKLPIGYDGESVLITFDPQLLIDALKVLEPDEEISLDVIDGKKATVLRTNDGYAYVVMPLTRERPRS